MIKATQKDYEELKADIDKVKDGIWGGFTKMNFIDYSQYLQKIKEIFKGNFIKIEQMKTGIRVSKIKQKRGI